ncbi:Thiamine-phosphate synthase [Hyella patelloides LEGE 07179]|uniref:Thiamine-phosphate synthase n=1 Tax=Hyella patelloides LEGE 07179 TaxID=945734 RepID=A0A563VQN8_9CYAN|nr:thiamine phosphate synthase [Hyella patelloides]VEP13743.1 Thiamine-phosphate synthase [Hyella patelloides LEGE 07179]
MQQAIYRILDANLDRAREGLRIIEEWCRFGLNNPSLAEECKKMRQELAVLHTWEIRQARDTPSDVGTELSHPREETRDSIESLLQANLARIQEALRVLEEYGKLCLPEMGGVCKSLRYRVYTLESHLLNSDRHKKLYRSSLYLVTSSSENLLAIVDDALRGGLTLVQYRDKSTDDNIRLVKAQQLCKLCHDYGALLLVNDRVDLALAVDADGVHLGQQDIPIALAKEILGNHKIVGRSTTNPDEMQNAIAEGADYIGVGPVYKTPTKPGKEPAGLEYIEYAAQNCPIPWFAIGGVNLTNINYVVAAGGQRVAVVRSIMESEQPSVTVRQFLGCLG